MSELEEQVVEAAEAEETEETAPPANDGPVTKSKRYMGPTLITAGSHGIMQKEAVYDGITNGSKSATGYKPYAGPTLVTAGSTGIMEKEAVYDGITNGSKSAKSWKPYAGPTMLTAGSAGIMERGAGNLSNVMVAGADVSNKIYGESSPTKPGVYVPPDKIERGEDQGVAPAAEEPAPAEEEPAPAESEEPVEEVQE